MTMVDKAIEASFPRPDVLGTFHKFGHFGVNYQVLQPLREANKSWVVEIEVLETGERLEYSLEAVLADPEAV